MKVLEFAFDGNPANDYKPSRYTENCLAYTGTHDNEPLLSFVEKNLETRGRSFYEEVKGECDKADIAMSGDTPVELCKTLLSLLFSSRASLVLIPMQDALLLGEEARINHPSTFSPDNWSYRFNNKDLNIDKKSWSFSLSNRYNR
jgi:4-alpha-glucanotransferase